MNERYDKTFFEGLDKLGAILEADKKHQTDRYREEIRSRLRTEILARAKGDKARIESEFKSDKQLQTAVNILKNSAVYNKLLNVKKK